MLRKQKQRNSLLFININRVGLSPEGMKKLLSNEKNVHQQSEYHDPYEDDIDNITPIITLEVMTDASITDTCLHANLNNEPKLNYPNENVTKDTTGVHFLMNKTNDEYVSTNILSYEISGNKEQEANPENSKARNDQLEYTTRDDGSVICRLCGEILQSRSHWYRHKYRFHVIHSLNPSPLFQCEQCLVFFKSRKGYIGHLASRHNINLTDPIPILTTANMEVLTKEKQVNLLSSAEIKEEVDPELSIPKSSVPNYQTTTTVLRSTAAATSTKSTETKRPYRTKVPEQPVNNADWEEQRSREEKLVTDIIDRVRRECEAQGSGGPTRRGYSRRTTIMHT